MSPIRTAVPTGAAAILLAPDLDAADDAPPGLRDAEADAEATFHEAVRRRT